MCDYSLFIAWLAVIRVYVKGEREKKKNKDK